jgi:FtsP/CotA-like multicopper oxidase with cupredoxin domain
MTYRFRVIGAATLYPFRVYVQHHPSIRIVASDGFEIKQIEVESFIINGIY